MTDPRSAPGPHTLHPAWPQVDALLEPWRRMDIAAIAATFEPDGVLHSMMGTPIRGQASIRKVLGKHLAGIRSIEFEIRNLAITGDVVILERVDHVYTAEGKHSLPVVGVLELRAGRVREWREYFDQAQAAPALENSQNPAIRHSPKGVLVSTDQEIHAFAERFIQALNEGNADTVRTFYAPDAAIWHNYDNAVQNLDDNMKVLEWMVRKAPQRSYHVVRREIIPGGWFQHHVVEAKLASGREMKMFACCVITLKDGLIHRIEEWLDPAQAAVLRDEKRASA